MHSCRRRALAAALLITCAGGALAQDPSELPEEAAARAALSKARGTYDEALRAIEAYGRGAPVSAERAREVAYDRLQGATGPDHVPTLRLDPDAAQEELLRFREAIRARLHELAPDKYPLDAWREPRPRRDVDEPLTLRMVDVQDLVVSPEDHVAPNTGLGAGLDSSGSHDDLSGHTMDTGLDGDKLYELLEATLGEHEGSFELTAGRLVTRLRADDFEQVQALLARLRQDRGGLVDLEVRIYRVQAATFARLRDQAWALTDAAEQALARGDGATLLASHHVLAHDGQRVHVWRGRSRSYVADIDVNQTGVVPVQEPRVAVINEGLVVEARPIVDRARGRVLLDVALSLTRLDPKVEVQKVEQLELETPLLKIARTTASASVPLGRGALLGGVLDTPGQPEDGLTCVVYVRPRLTESKRKR